jgi:hypothetical protein
MKRAVAFSERWRWAVLNSLPKTAAVQEYDYESVREQRHPKGEFLFRGL